MKLLASSYDIKQKSDSFKIDRKCNWFYRKSNNKNISENADCGVVALTAGVLTGPLKVTKTFNTKDVEALKNAASNSNGSYTFIIIHEKDLIVVTDESGSIPLYFGNGSTGVAIGTHAHEVASATGLKEMDHISVVDYLIYETICHPYSWYKGIERFPPGSVCSINTEGEIQIERYYVPEESSYPMKVMKKEIRFWGRRLFELNCRS